MTVSAETSTHHLHSLLTNLKLHQSYTTEATAPQTTRGDALSAETQRGETPDTYLHSHEGFQIIRGLEPKGTRGRKQQVMRKGLHHVWAGTGAFSGSKPQRAPRSFHCFNLNTFLIRLPKLHTEEPLIKHLWWFASLGLRFRDCEAGPGIMKKLRFKLFLWSAAEGDALAHCKWKGAWHVLRMTYSDHFQLHIFILGLYLSKSKIILIYLILGFS